MPAEIVKPPAIANCPIQLECVLQEQHILQCCAKGLPMIASVHMKVVHVRVQEQLVINTNYINPAAWSPLIYNFRHYYALGRKLGANSRAEVL